MLQEMQRVDIAVELDNFDELNQQEERDRLNLERRVERAFFVAGKALTELRDRRLYRSTHRTFEEYCKDRFAYSRRQPYLLMDAAIVFDNLEQKCDQFDHILPTAEGQVRPLTKLKPQEQQEVWQAAVEQAGGKVPTGRIVKDVIQLIIERTKVLNTYQLGEVCQIIVKDNPDLRGKGECWAIVTQVNEYSCTVMTWDGEHTLRVDHLKSMNYTDSECQDMQSLSVRINTIRNNENLEEAADAVLKHLGQLKRPYLTEFEAELLSFIESKCRK
ncbi:hypothetical protein [Halotia branconii]|uniref:Uncharacterized protein n=1 Tax=Halotia branconii CENA392 TaxID=1539056 RepID=A0AAJ6NYZ9_9CYAN|nr:hypothetical protein [Halotia branconii]WGV29091.1 hypothetical protein QI031_31520 [Halotia branconii CENA392]